MKRILSLVLCAVLVFSLTASVCANEYSTQKMVITVDYVNMLVNGQQVFMHNFVHEGTTYIGLRDAGNTFGYDVSWDDSTRTATFTYGVTPTPVTDIPSTEYYITEIDALVDYATIVIDGVTVQARNFINNGTTYVALRDIGTMFKYNVGWDETTRTASLNKISIDYSKISGKINDIVIPDYLIKVQGQIIIDSAANIEEVHKSIEQTALAYAHIEEIKEKYNLSLSDEDVADIDAEFDEIVKNQFGGKEIFDIILTQSNLTYDEYSKYYKTVSEFDIIYLKLIKKISSDSEIAKADREQALMYYEENKDSFNLPAVRVKHILIPTVDQTTGQPLSEDDIASAKAKANAIHAQASRRNANFESLISQNNNDPGMPSEGYYVYEDSGMVKEFEIAALNLKANHISPVIETSYGYHIIKAYEIFDSIPFEALYHFDVNTYVSNELAKWTATANIQFTW